MCGALYKSAKAGDRCLFKCVHINHEGVLLVMLTGDSLKQRIG